MKVSRGRYFLPNEINAGCPIKFEFQININFFFFFSKNMPQVLLCGPAGSSTPFFLFCLDSHQFIHSTYTLMGSFSVLCSGCGEKKQQNWQVRCPRGGRDYTR